MTISARQLGGGSNQATIDSHIDAASAVDSGPARVVRGAAAGEAALDPDRAPGFDGGTLVPTNDRLMRAIEIGVAGLAFGSAVLLAFMR